MQRTHTKEHFCTRTVDSWIFKLQVLYAACTHDALCKPVSFFSSYLSVFLSPDPLCAALSGPFM